jgi:hypothetical protein
MDNIPKEIRANLKRLCPYIGPSVPDLIRERAREFWAPHDPEEWATWQWDDGSGDYQWELELSNLDEDFIDPEGYVAIRPLAKDKYALIFMICAEWPEGFDPQEDLVFQTMQEAKRYLDTLLAAETPEIPPHKA